jgi:hypothetical protein
MSRQQLKAMGSASTARNCKVSATGAIRRTSLCLDLLEDISRYAYPNTPAEGPGGTVRVEANRWFGRGKRTHRCRTRFKNIRVKTHRRDSIG